MNWRQDMGTSVPLLYLGSACRGTMGEDCPRTLDSAMMKLVWMLMIHAAWHNFALPKAQSCSIHSCCDPWPSLLAPYLQELSVFGATPSLRIAASQWWSSSNAPSCTPRMGNSYTSCGPEFQVFVQCNFFNIVDSKICQYSFFYWDIQSETSN